MSDSDSGLLHSHLLKKLIWALRHLVIFTTPDGVTYCLCGQLNHQHLVSNTTPDGRQRSFSCSVIAVWGERFSFYGSSLSISVKQQTNKKKKNGTYLWDWCSLGSAWAWRPSLVATTSTRWRQSKKTKSLLPKWFCFVKCIIAASELCSDIK